MVIFRGIEYEVSEFDEEGEDFSYYSFCSLTDEWFIKRVSSENVKFARGYSNYDSSWANKENLVYDTFKNTFG